MEELGRDDDVLDWARRGIAETSGWQVAQRYDPAAGVYARRGDSKETLRLRRDQHNHMASSTTYNLLRTVAEELGIWESERPHARSTLASRDIGGLVDVLLADGEPDAAWQAAVNNPACEPGEHRWMRLAEAREPSRPDDALGVYLRLADIELETTGRAAYTRAEAILKKAARAANAASRKVEFVEHLAALRDRHGRRPTLISILDKAGLR